MGRCVPRYAAPLEKLAGILNGFDAQTDERVVPHTEPGCVPPVQRSQSGRIRQGNVTPRTLSIRPRIRPGGRRAERARTCPPEATFARLGIYDASPTSLDVLAGSSHPINRLALAIASAEYALV